jgi:hypothetical protein
LFETIAHKMIAKITIIKTDRLAMAAPPEKSEYEANSNEARASRLGSETRELGDGSIRVSIPSDHSRSAGIAQHDTSVIVERAGGSSQRPSNCGTCGM